MSHDPYFRLGTQIGAVSLGHDPAELPSRVGRDNVMSSLEAAPFNRELCKIAYAAFEADGQETSARAILFRNLAQERDWNSGYDRFTDSVKRALAKTASVLPAIVGLHDKAGGGVMKTLTAGGALGGAALGSLAFLLSRNASQSSAENSQLLEKIRAYKQLRRDIEEDMDNNDVMPGGKAKTSPKGPKEERYDV